MTGISVRFTRSCPTCGRRVEIRASLLGRTVACQHCGANFTANSSDDPVDHFDDGHRLMARVEQALNRPDSNTKLRTPPGTIA